MIKCLAESQAPKLLLELYREVKKNASSRTLRAGLCRFADLSHLIRPAKRRPYFSNLLPCIMKIIQRTGEESVQETLTTALSKLMPVFGKFATDPEISGLLKALMANLQNGQAAIRRLAAGSICCVIQHSNKPAYFVSWLVNLLLQTLSALRNREQQPPITTITDDNYAVTTAGIFLAFKCIVPLLNEIPAAEETAGLPAAFRSRTAFSPSELQILIDNLVHMYELLLASIRSESDHLIVVSALDALAQLLKSPPKILLPVLTSAAGISRSRICDQVRGCPAASPTVSQRRLRGSSSSSFNFSSESVLEEEEQLVISNELHKLHVPVRTPTTLSPSFSESASVTDGPDEVSDSELDVEMDDTGSELSATPHDYNKNSRLDNNVMKLTYMDDDNFTASPDQTIASPTPFNNRTGDIGSFTDTSCPLEYCCRLICSHFLLDGTKRGLLPDSAVRISVKSLALSCLSSIVTLHPQAILLHLFRNEDKSEHQKVWDVIQLCKHSDPQLRSQVLLLIASLVTTILSHIPSYTDFLLRHCPPASFAEAPALDDLLNHFVTAMKDMETCHPVSIKSALLALQSSFHLIVRSEEALPHAIQLIEDAISLKDQNYWLIRVELLNFLSAIQFKDIFYLESSHKSFPSLQDEIISGVLLPLVCDEDHRIRNAAAAAVVKIVPLLFLPTNQLDGDVVTSMSAELMNKRLTSFSSGGRQSLTFPHRLLPSTEFVEPFSTGYRTTEDETVSRNLKHMTALLEDRLIGNMDKKNCTIGVIGALAALSHAFHPTIWRRGWSGSLSFPTVLLSLLTSSANPVLVDVHVHERMISHVSQVLCGLSYECICDAASAGTTVADCEVQNWAAVSIWSPELVQLLDSFMSHLLKLLYIVSCVASEVTPNTTSGPTAPSAKSSSSFHIPLSPLRRMSKDIGDLKSDSSRKGKDSHTSNYLDSTLCKFYEVLKSSFLSHRTSSDFGVSRFAAFAGVVLSVLSRMFELCTLTLIGSKTEVVIEQISSLIAVDPVSCVSCVQQLLKSVFGTNFALLSLTDGCEPAAKVSSQRSSVSSVQQSSNRVTSCCGLYQTIFSNPYSQYSQLYGAKWISSQTLPSHVYSQIEATSSMQMHVRKAFERRIAYLSEKTSAMSADSQTNIKAFLITYIKMFEPVVIRSLKMYTTTSDVRLQTEILNLLSILVKVRVNYCLLDSDFVFLDFVQKQFEFIEGGLISHSEQLIDAIFSFLTLLSYERVDRKQVLPVARLIQLSDGLLASNQPAKDCVVPALRHLVHDLFLYRTAAKVESVKELETQREVVLATLLKISPIPQSIELLVLIVQSMRKDSDEKWKKVSRTVMDTVLPHVMKQQVDMRNWQALDDVHQLFESVSPIVFRPVDIVLTALFSPPADDVLVNGKSFCRWFSSVLLLMRIMMMQTKEEVVLTRFQELRKGCMRVGSHRIICFEDAISTSRSAANFPAGKSSEEMFAEFFLQTFQLSVTQLSQHSGSGNEFLATQVSHYLLYLTYLFQSGSFRRTSKAAAIVVKKSLGQNTDLSAFSMNCLNDVLVQIRGSHPVLLLQWLNVLLLLGFNDSPESGMGDGKAEENNRFFWSQHLQAARDQDSVIPASLELIRRGTIVLLCDFACESMSNAEQMTWLIINHIHEILLWSHELPVRDFIHTIHRNPASSALFIQSINSRCFLLKDPCLTRKLLSAVQFIHPTQSGPLVALLVEQVVVNSDVSAFVTLTTAAQKLAVERIDMLMKSESMEEMTSQLSVEDVARLLMLISRRRHQPLFSSLQRLGRVIAQVADPEPEVPVHWDQTPDACGKDFFLRLTQHSCSHRSHSHETLPAVVHKLHHEDIRSLLSCPDFVISCLDAGVCEEEESARRPSLVLFSDPESSRNRLLSSALISLNAQLDQLSSISISCNEDSEVVESSFTQMISFADGFAKLMRIGSKNRSSPESLRTMLSLVTAYADALTHATRAERTDLTAACLTVLSAMAGTEPLLSLLEEESSFDHLFRIIESLHYYVDTNFRLPVLQPPKRFADLELVNPEWKRPHEACMRASQLLSFVSSSSKKLVFQEELRLLILSLCRIPVLNSFVMVPPLIWKIGSWHPNFCGNWGTVCPTVPSEELRDAAVLTEFTTRIALLGWRSRIQFEEFWMSLLGVISLLQSGDSSESFDESDVCSISTIAVKGITHLLMQTLLIPDAGDPVTSQYIVLKQECIPHFTHSKYGQKLVKLTETLSYQRKHNNKCKKETKVGYGHISVEFFKEDQRTGRKEQAVPHQSVLSLVRNVVHVVRISSQRDPGVGPDAVQGQSGHRSALLHPLPAGPVQPAHEQQDDCSAAGVGRRAVAAPPLRPLLREESVRVDAGDVLPALQAGRAPRGRGGDPVPRLRDHQMLLRPARRSRVGDVGKAQKVRRKWTEKRLSLVTHQHDSGTETLSDSFERSSGEGERGQSAVVDDGLPDETSFRPVSAVQQQHGPRLPHVGPVLRSDPESRGRLFGERVRSEDLSSGSRFPGIGSPVVRGEEQDLRGTGEADAQRDVCHSRSGSDRQNVHGSHEKRLPGGRVQCLSADPHVDLRLRSVDRKRSRGRQSVGID